MKAFFVNSLNEWKPTLFWYAAGSLTGAAVFGWGSALVAKAVVFVGG